MIIKFDLLKKNREYRLLFIGQLVSFFGSMMSYVAVPYQIYELTQSNANKFCKDLNLYRPNSCKAILSRDLKNAKSFSQTHNIKTSYDSLESFLSDDSIDVVYIATPHSSHHTYTLKCLNAKKPTLCEKPIAINSHQALEMIECAKSNQTFLMEGMWTKCFPIIKEIQNSIQRYDLGKIQNVSSKFGYKFPKFDPEHRLYKKIYAGGALLDIGVYTISLIHLLLGTPLKTKTQNLTWTPNQVDESSHILFEFSNSATAESLISINTNYTNDTEIFCEKGSLKIENPWWGPREMTITKGSERFSIKQLYEGHGFCFEIEEVENCLNQNKLESDAAPLDDTLSVMKILDSLRKEWGLVYPGE